MRKSQPLEVQGRHQIICLIWEKNGNSNTSSENIQFNIGMEFAIGIYALLIK